MVYTRQQKRVKSIVSRMLSGLLEYSFTEWAQAIAEDAAEKRRLRELAGFHSEMETQKNSMKILARAVQTWCAFARHKAARLQAMHRVMQRIQNMALSCCFRQWQATAHHAARVRSIGTRAMKHISNLAIAKAFGAMCAYVRRRKLIRSILTRLRHQLAWSVFTEWMDLVAREVHKRRQQQLLHEENAAAMEARASAHDAEIRALKAEVYAAKARLETHERYVVDNIAEIEKHHTEQLDAHREQYQQIIADVKHEHAGELARVYTQALQEAFAVRPAAEIPAVAERNPEELLQQAARRIRNVQMANGFTRWCGFAQGRKRHRQALQRAVRTMQQRDVSSAFWHWRDDTFHAQASKASELQQQEVVELQTQLADHLTQSKAAQEQVQEVLSQTLSQMNEMVMVEDHETALRDTKAEVESTRTAERERLVAEHQAHITRITTIEQQAREVLRSTYEHELRAAKERNQSAVQHVEITRRQHAGVAAEHADLVAERHSLMQRVQELTQQADSAQRQVAVMSHLLKVAPPQGVAAAAAAAAADDRHDRRSRSPGRSYAAPPAHHHQQQQQQQQQQKPEE
jgi:hypothetical protein